MSGAGRLVRAAATDAVRAVRAWQPPDRPEPQAAARPQRRGRAAEPVWGRGPTASTARRVVQRRALFPLLEGLARPEVRGIEHVHAVAPPLILAPNHASHADAPLVLKALPPAVRERTLVPAAADYFFDRHWLSVGVTLAMNAVPFDRRHDIADSVRRCERFLRYGYSVLLFPEGTRSSDGRLRGFKAGVAHLAAQTGAPVLPVYVQGTHALLPRGARLPRPSRVAIHFGPALHAGDGESARSFNERLEAAVATLAGQARGRAYRERPPDPPGWRDLWARTASATPRRGAQPSLGASASWRDTWRSSTPR